MKDLFLVYGDSFCDPNYAQGMAHYLEHMLFMGSEKYPSENEYDSFLSQNGGSSNAYTDCEVTNYHLEVPQEHLHKALDIFAQFFISSFLSIGDFEPIMEIGSL